MPEPRRRRPSAHRLTHALLPHHFIFRLPSRPCTHKLFVIAFGLIACGILLSGFGPVKAGANLSSTSVIDSSWSMTGALNTNRHNHTATLLPNGKVLVAGGLTEINSFIGDGVTGSAELYDPSTGTWKATGSLSTARANHTATLLPSGKVLVAGGNDFNSSKQFASAELYDPSTGTWSATASLNVARDYHTATLLQNGKVLVAGGVSNSDGPSSAELYDPATGTWTITGSLHTVRSDHTATLLSNGKVLIAGGAEANTNSFASAGAELYDPATGTWSVTGSLNTGRREHTATLLVNGKVLIVGGMDAGFNFLDSAELYDPATGTWSATGSLSAARHNHTATLLPSGKVLVAGGDIGPPTSFFGSAELYDPATGTWSLTASLNNFRSNHTATLLSSGKVLVVGGYALNSAELYDSANLSWGATGSLITARRNHTTTLLANGKILIVGGVDNGPNFLASAELYDPSTGKSSATGSLNTARYSHTATLLQNGKVLVAGGQNKSGRLSSAELYDPATGAWTITGPLSTVRGNHTATLLQNGKVLVAGGDDETVPLASAELYDPSTGTWSATASLNVARDYHTATLLQNGKVLVAGGSLNAGNLSSAELYDPATGMWSTTGSLNTARALHTATLLPGGKVLVVGGGVFASAELYDPATGAWSATGSLNNARSLHAATLLPDGKVLVAGGFNAAKGTALASAELYDPATGAWSATGSLNLARHSHTATLLPNGRVFVAGGSGNADSIISSTEFYDAAVGSRTGTSPLNAARYLHTATLLPNGKVLVAGGQVNDGFHAVPLSSAELYDPATGTWTATGSLNFARTSHTATLLPNGKVLVAGGFGVQQDNNYVLTSAELYDPSTGNWSITGSLNSTRANHTATLLPNGKVLVASGDRDERLGFHEAELYDPSTEKWTVTGSLKVHRSFHTATLLPNGKVLVACGSTTLDPTLTAELYDPATGTWTAAGRLKHRHSHHTATLLPNGKVLVAGGLGDYSFSESAELYDPATNTWALTGALTGFRVDHTAALLPNGKVLVVGGDYSQATIAELYDPATGTWSATASLNTTLSYSTATLLPSGKVLLAGGRNQSIFNAVADAELYDVGLGFAAASQPVITSATSPLRLTDKLVLNGARFRGVSGASSDNTQSSPANYPVVQLLSLVNEQSRLLPSDPDTNWTDTSFTSRAVTDFPKGYALVTVFANGVPSASRLIQVVGLTPAFSNLSGPTITYKTATTTLSGKISAVGGSIVPTGSVSITIGGVTAQADVQSDGTFSTDFPTASLAVSGSPYTITYNYSGDGLYEGVADSSRKLTVDKATPVITWNNPANIIVGTALSSTQLNATANVPGTFSYAPPPGAVFNSTGTYQLSVTFNPSDTSNYTTASKSVQLTVDPATPTLTFSSSAYSVSEASGHLAITVIRTGDTRTAATVNFATSDTAVLQPCSVLNGVASSRCDYAMTVGTLQFAAGETTKTIFIPVVNDSYVEGNESFAVALYNPAGALLGSVPTATVTITDDDNGVKANPITDDSFFVRQLYIDFLDREPDPAGLQGWLDLLRNTSGKCKVPTDCDRIAVALGFVRSPEFQDRGYFVFRFYSAALGRNPNYNEFIPDMARLSGFLNSPELEANKSAFVDEFVSRSEFKNLYDSTLNDPAGYVDKLLKSAGLPNHPARNTWIAGLTSGTLSRAQVLRALVESTEVYSKYYNQAIIVMNYFAFLRRDPDAAYQTWIDIFNHSGDYRILVNGFINSPEYVLRFGP